MARLVCTIVEKRVVDTMMMDAKIFVVVPVFNRWAYLERFLDCFRKQTYQNFEMIVVDDGSTDGTCAFIQERYPEVTLLRGDGNLWWTGAINVGIRCALDQAAEIDAVLVINDDLEVDPDYLKILHHLLQKMPRTLVGSVVVDINDPDLINQGGVKLNMLTAKYKVLNQNKRLSEFDQDYAIDVSLLTGRGTLIPVQVFYEVGLFDDKHFQQCGDMDLSIRARYVGYRLIESYRAIVKSHEEKT
jgi:GT2 family glycosyltransferase